MRPRPLSLVISAVFVVVAGACTDTGGSTTAPPESTSGSAQPTTVATTVAPDDLAPCLAGEFVSADQGLIATFGEAAGDATMLASVRLGQHNGCERIVLDLATGDGAPAATLGPTTVRHAPEIGVVTVRLPPELATTALNDLVLDGQLAERFFVYRDIEGLVTLDIHLQDAADVRAFALSGPARIVVDLRPTTGGPPRIGSPIVGRDVVVLAPLTGPAEYPLTVRGYARHPAAMLSVELRVDDIVDVRVNGVAAAAEPAWGAFAVTIDDGPTGNATLAVGFENEEAQLVADVTVTVDLR